MDREDEIIKDLQEERVEIDCIETEIKKIRERLLDRVPEHYSKRDMINAFFGSLTIGITFILKGATVRTAVGLDVFHTELVIAATLMILFVEIYFIGYSRVKNKSQRKLGQFMTKRLIALYGITLLISVSLVYLLNLNNSEYVTSFMDVMKIVVVVSFPCAIGAAVPSLLKKY
jgi:uncharacterized membrane protein